MNLVLQFIIFVVYYGVMVILKHLISYVFHLLCIIIYINRIYYINFLKDSLLLPRVYQYKTNCICYDKEHLNDYGGLSVRISLSIFYTTYLCVNYVFYYLFSKIQYSIY